MPQLLPNRLFPFRRYKAVMSSKATIELPWPQFSEFVGLFNDALPHVDAEVAPRYLEITFAPTHLKAKIQRNGDVS